MRGIRRSASVLLLLPGLVLLPAALSGAVGSGPDPGDCAAAHPTATCPPDGGGYRSGPPGTTYTFVGPTPDPTHVQCGDLGCIGEGDAWYNGETGEALPANCPHADDQTKCDYTVPGYVVDQPLYVHLHVDLNFGHSTMSSKDFWVYAAPTAWTVTPAAHDANGNDVTSSSAYTAGKGSFYFVKPGADPVRTDCQSDGWDITGPPPACVHMTHPLYGMVGMPSIGTYDLILPDDELFSSQKVRSAVSSWTVVPVVFDARKTVAVTPKGSAPPPSSATPTPTPTPTQKPSPSPSPTATVTACVQHCLLPPVVTKARLATHPVKKPKTAHPGAITIDGQAAAGVPFTVHLLRAASCVKGALVPSATDIKHIAVVPNAAGAYRVVIKLAKLTLKQGFAAYLASPSDTSVRSTCRAVS